MRRIKIHKVVILLLLVVISRGSFRIPLQIVFELLRDRHVILLLLRPRNISLLPLLLLSIVLPQLFITRIQFRSVSLPQQRLSLLYLFRFFLAVLLNLPALLLLIKSKWILSVHLLIDNLLGGISLVQSFVLDKIPVVLIHILSSSYMLSRPFESLRQSRLVLIEPSARHIGDWRPLLDSILRGRSFLNIIWCREITIMSISKRVNWFPLNQIGTEN